jgi:HPt (histidine-containing phosphotransfer) domain-containing protein
LTCDPAVKEGKGIHLNNSPSSQSGNAEEQAKREDGKKNFPGFSTNLRGREGLEEMIAAFLDELPGLRQRWALFLEEGKTAEAAREFHKLKGSLSYLVGPEERDLARRAEEEARQGVLSPRSGTVRKLERFLDGFDRFLRERKKKPAR